MLKAAVMKSSRENRSRKRADRGVAWWSTLLLAALGAVLTALFLSGRLLLSLEEPGTEQTRVPVTALPHPDDSVAVARRPNGSEPLRFDATIEGGSILGNYVSVATLQR
jgi:hypothetical protein